ncbi:MAG: NAD(P)H-dependent glycerol-3-phosphate dehydrogenase [Desulfuromonadales bacterium]|nr:NAD(P)H-dependent glycerol-3-phosphate dehydrogenase [Desulfuromonadales bacterium]MDH3867772.1 NAD(P)H-dependent glycerol-3-phosphate dehydrogenase [Desulfuromonadales bacterium]MDH3959737.1 NAD(P)H-dependent glycerol-3-phosphate dehydrogenase [Desulfuromonadales bacterium]MDH4025484.1 NAD(P)H-dependent glycerol-3-phosphate dehydrogenase [Desulfuromonadales bacterium]
MKIGVIGAGSWGTTLANVLAKKGHDVTLWVYEADLAKRLQETGVNDLYLDGITLSSKLAYTNDLSEAAQNSQLILLVSPSQVMRHVLKDLKAYIPEDCLLVSAAKGIENGTLLTMSEVLQEVLGEQVAKRSAFLSGPSFAREVAAEQPTAVTVAAVNPEVAHRVQEIFSTDYFRVYTNQDVVGVEIGGAMKNVIALAAGVGDGLGFNHNARAALITRGLVEISRLGEAKGAQEATFSGLAGMGDLVLTCTGDLSRNRSVGIELGKGRKLDEILNQMRMVAEGVKTTLSAYQLATKLGVAMPITEQMYQVLYEEKDPKQAAADLMTRALTSEDE